ncbi:MAG: HEAT repeat domain-containing protein [Planctomycetaceae bacterium]
MPHTLENPFAVKQRRQLTPLLSGLKGLAMIAALFAVLVIAQAQSRRWLLERWVTGLAELPVAEQVQRVLQIDALGDIATETIARRLAAPESTVAATAYDLLREHQNDWSTRDSDDLGRAHQNMIRGIEAVADELQGDRARWAVELLNQSLLECVDRDVRELDEAYQAATRVLAVLVPAPAESALASDATNSPLPLTPAATHRPRLVPMAARLQQVATTADAAGSNSIAEADPALVPLAAENETHIALAAQPRITDVSTQASAPEFQQPVPAVAQAVAGSSVQPVRHLTESSLQTFEIKSVIGLLGTQQAEVRDRAVEELVRRGLSNEEIRVANQLASPTVEVRLGLLESIIHRTDLDPRPWLLWLAEDQNREVRMRAISTLATMNDASVKQALQKRLQSEHDSAVAAHIRRAIESR